MSAAKSTPETIAAIAAAYALLREVAKRVERQSTSDQDDRQSAAL